MFEEKYASWPAITKTYASPEYEIKLGFVNGSMTLLLASIGCPLPFVRITAMYNPCFVEPFFTGLEVFTKMETI